VHCCRTDGDPRRPSGAPAGSSPSASLAKPAPRLRRFAAFAQWAMPIAALALVPKCPACVAAYVLLFTGVGLSFPAAAALRWTLIALSIGTLACLLLRAARRAIARVR